MLRVGRSEDNGQTNFVLSGRIEEKHISELRDLIEDEPNVEDVMLDLEEVKLVNREAVRFLAGCEAQGVKLMNCPPYIRAWIRTGAM